MNNVHMLNAERITKSSDLTRKSNARLGGPQFGSNSVRSKTPVKCRGGGYAGCGFGIDWYIKLAYI